jgi:hypothetical protein
MYEYKCLHCALCLTNSVVTDCLLKLTIILQIRAAMMQRPLLVMWWCVLCSILVSSESEYSVITSILHAICGHALAVIERCLPSYDSDFENMLAFHVEIEY